MNATCWNLNFLCLQSTVYCVKKASFLRIYSIRLNSVYCLQPNITNYKCTICTHRHPCPRTSHRIRKNSQKTLQGGKGEETFRRATEEDPSPGWTEAKDVMWPEGIITELHKQIQWIWQSVWIVGSRHIPRSRPPWSIKHMEVERSYQPIYPLECPDPFSLSAQHCYSQNIVIKYNNTVFRVAMLHSNSAEETQPLLRSSAWCFAKWMLDIQ